MWWILILFLVIANIFLLAKMLHYRKVSLQDEFLDLPNFRALIHYLNNNNNQTLKFALIDLDNFKEFNRISIQNGDRILQEFASVLKQKLSDKAYIARYRHGDEFVLVFKTNIHIDEEMNKLMNFLKTYQLKTLNEASDCRIAFSFAIGTIEKKERNYNLCFENAEKLIAEKKQIKKSGKAK